MRLVVDANILICVNGFGVWPKLRAFLQPCELTLITIESVYRREIPDALRPTLDQMTDERPLQELANHCNVPVSYDLLDVIDALHAGQAINAQTRQNLLSGNPGGRQDSFDDLEQTLSARGGGDRFDCVDSDELS